MNQFNGEMKETKLYCFLPRLMDFRAKINGLLLKNMDEPHELFHVICFQLEYDQNITQDDLK